MSTVAYCGGSDFAKLKQQTQRLHDAYIADFNKARAATTATLGLLKRVDVRQATTCNTRGHAADRHAHGMKRTRVRLNTVNANPSLRAFT